MLFNSFSFLFLFFPITLIGYFTLGRFVSSPIYPMGFLVIASLVFYGCWNINFISILLSSIIINYLFSFWIGSSSQTQKKRKIAFIIAVIFNLLLLGFYKYINFGIEILNNVWDKKLSAIAIILPLGISFFTFTQIAYLADILRDHPKEKNIIKYMLFVTYFPHLIAGPILHHKEMMPQFYKNIHERFSLEKIAIGLTIFAIGLFKKVVIADTLSLISNPIFNAVKQEVISMVDAWGGVLAYTLQIYFDFSGYSDMAIGLSLMFGIILPFNFDSPYKSRSIIEFWQRWHITLSRFLKDYLYIPLGGNRCGSFRRYTNLIFTMLLGGLWHGAGWTFVIWGFLHGLYLTINHAWRNILSRFPSLLKISTTKLYVFMTLLLTQCCIIIAWIYFRADNVLSAHRMLKCMFHYHMHKKIPLQQNISLINFLFIIFIYFICICLPNVNAMFDEWKVGLKTYQTKKTWNVVNLTWNMSLKWSLFVTFILIASLVCILMVGDGTQFLYFQF